MPTATVPAVRTQIAQRKPAPVYLILGDDEAEMARLVAELTALVEEDLRPFSTDRIYAGEKGVTPASIVESARILPMMSDRRVVVVLRMEKILKPRRRGRADEEASEVEDDGDAPAPDADPLAAYVQHPVAETTLVLVATDVDRSRRLWKALQKHATVVPCWGLKGSANDPRDVKSWELEKINREAAALVARTLKESGYSIPPQAAKLVADRAGTDISILRGDVERLLLYVGDRKTITLDDVNEVVSGETLQDKWALGDAVVDRNEKRALKQLALAFEGGAVSYMLLGQLAHAVRVKMAERDPRRVRAAVEALFRTDLELKSSGGDPRVLLERLVVELCGG
jgi:DNA polymerase-3 subunit delta